MKVSEQIKWVAIGWILYGIGSLSMLMLGIDSFERFWVILALVNMVFGSGLYFRNKVIIQVSRIYLWILLLAISSFPFGFRADFGVDSKLTARMYIVPVFEIVFLLWFFRRICVAKELARDKASSVEEPIEGIGKQLAIKNPLVWWFLIVFLTSGIWAFLR